MSIEPFVWQDDDGQEHRVVFSQLACHHGGIFFSDGVDGIPTHLLQQFTEWLLTVQAELKRREREHTRQVLKTVAQESSMGDHTNRNLRPDADMGPFQMRTTRTFTDGVPTRQDVRRNIESFFEGFDKFA